MQPVRVETRRFFSLSNTLLTPFAFCGRQWQALSPMDQGISIKKIGDIGRRIILGIGLVVAVIPGFIGSCIKIFFISLPKGGDPTELSINGHFNFLLMGEQVEKCSQTLFKYFDPRVIRSLFAEGLKGGPRFISAVHGGESETIEGCPAKVVSFTIKRLCRPTVRDILEKTFKEGLDTPPLHSLFIETMAKRLLGVVKTELEYQEKIFLSGIERIELSIMVRCEQNIVRLKITPKS